MKKDLSESEYILLRMWPYLIAALFIFLILVFTVPYQGFYRTSDTADIGNAVGD
jgi:hypothetical protein